MAKRRSTRVKARKGGRPKTGRALEAGPTAQTLAKLQPDPILEALEIGAIDERQASAACDIRDAIMAVTGQVGWRAAGIGADDGPGASATDSPRSAWLQGRMTAWLAAMRDGRCPTGPVRLLIDGTRWRALITDQQRAVLWALDAWIQAARCQKAA